MTHLKQWIEDYDNGKEVLSVEMGGISQGYEIAIQDCAISIMRELQDREAPEDVVLFRSIIEEATEKAVSVLDKKHGFSGAQVGAATNIASIFWRKSPKKGIEQMRNSDSERIIAIRKGENDLPEFVNPKIYSLD